VNAWRTLSCVVSVLKEFTPHCREGRWSTRSSIRFEVSGVPSKANQAWRTSSARYPWFWTDRGFWRIAELNRSLCTNKVVGLSGIRAVENYRPDLGAEVSHDVRCVPMCVSMLWCWWMLKHADDSGVHPEFETGFFPTGDEMFSGDRVRLMTVWSSC